MSTISFDHYVKKVFYSLEIYTIKTSHQDRKTVYPVRVLDKFGKLIREIPTKEVQKHLDKALKLDEKCVFVGTKIDRRNKK